MNIFIIICFLFMVPYLCTEVDVTVSTEQYTFFDSEGMEEEAEGKHVAVVKNSTISKKTVGCKSKDCENVNATDAASKILIRRYKQSKTPPKSYNFLASLAPIPPDVKNKSGMFPKERISIFSLNEKGGDARDWPAEYNFEVVHPDYEMEKSDGEYIEEDGGTTRSNVETLESISLWGKVFEGAELKNKNKEETTKLYTEIKFSTKDLHKHTSNKGNVKIPYIRKYSGAIKYLTPKFYKYTKKKSSFTTLTPSIFINTSNNGDKHIENVSIPPNITSNKMFRFGLVRKSNHSYRIVPYPVYFTAEPVIRKEKLVIPYPYFIRRADKEKQPHAVEDYQKDGEDGNETWVEKYPKENHFENDPVVEIQYGDDYMVLENDEDYVPSTVDYDDYDISVTQDIDSTSASASTTVPEPSISLKQPTISPEATSSQGLPVMPIHVTVTSHDDTSPVSPATRNLSFKYPNPYHNGTIYSYYDCSELSAASKSIVYKLLNILVISHTHFYL
uniref:Uncharacterized protein n=1 Tax=Cuerna arida TaxID=1464854 RepID=A0A1B6FRR2_9HEMI